MWGFVCSVGERSSCVVVGALWALCGLVGADEGGSARADLKNGLELILRLLGGRFWRDLFAFCQFRNPLGLGGVEFAYFLNLYPEKGLKQKCHHIYTPKRVLPMGSLYIVATVEGMSWRKENSRARS
jgi:hypothetical protein